MGFRYILVNHTLKVIEETGLNCVFRDIKVLIKESGWSLDDDVEMMYEENSWEDIGKCVKSGYKGYYHVRDFD